MARTRSSPAKDFTAMVAIERDNPRLKGVLPKDYARPGLDKHRFPKRLNP